MINILGLNDALKDGTCEWRSREQQSTAPSTTQGLAVGIRNKNVFSGVNIRGLTNM